MKPIARLLLIVCMLSAALVAGWPSRAAEANKATFPPARPELAYLKQVNEWRPPADPQLVFILMAQFANAGRHVEGIEYFNGLLARFGSQLTSTQKAQYLTAIASLRAGQANDVFLLRRIGWVKDTLALLDEANRLTGGNLFVARWMSGLVRAQIPGFFGEREAALTDLLWCVQHADQAPHVGWLREVYFSLARVYRQRRDIVEAARYQQLSGYTSETKPAIFTTPFSGDAAAGHRFSPRAMREIVPGSVFVLSGFEFTEFYFVISSDRKELIAIDAGTRPDTARSALEALRARVPDLPPLTTVLVTHAHWDHVGGHRYFRGLNPAMRFIGRSNYQTELDHDASANPATLKRFFGASFSLDDVLSYKPDVAIDRPTQIRIGGTRFSLLPTRGGETDDAMLVHMPDQGVLFVGDILMPYFGAPFVEEGSIDGLLASIEQVNGLMPRHLLHGHEPLTRIFSSTQMLADLATQLAWLRDEVLRRMKTGTERAAIHQENLIPPALAKSSSDVHLAYLVLRENMINRLFDQHSGYWQNGLKGLDHLSDADRGAALADYLGVSESQLAGAAERMIADGRHELAAALIAWWRARNPDSPTLEAVHRLAQLKLMEKYQEFNPFKFILYAGEIDQATAQIEVPWMGDNLRAPGRNDLPRLQESTRPWP